MPDTRIENLTQLVTAAIVDRMAIVDDPTGTPATKYINVDDFWESLESFTQLATGLAGTDTLGVIDGGAIKYMTILDFLASAVEDAITEITSGFAGSDTLLTIDGGVAKFTTLLSFFAGIEDALTAITSGYDGADTLLTVDGGVAKITTLLNFFAGIEDALTELAAQPAQADTLLLIDGGVAKFVTKKNFQVRYVQLEPFSFVDSTACATGDGKAYLHIPADLAGLDLVELHAEAKVAGTTNTMDIMIHNLTQAVNMLTVALTMDSAETGTDTAATGPTIDTDNDDVAENDLLRIDVDAVHTTPATGCILTLGFA